MCQEKCYDNNRQTRRRGGEAVVEQQYFEGKAGQGNVGQGKAGQDSINKVRQGRAKICRLRHMDD